MIIMNVGKCVLAFAAAIAAGYAKGRFDEHKKKERSWKN